MITLLHNFSISPTSWLVKKTVVLYSLFYLLINTLIFSLTTGSNPMVGSSKNNISGLCISEHAISHLILWPKDKFLTGVYIISSNQE